MNDYRQSVEDVMSQPEPKLSRRVWRPEKCRNGCSNRARTYGEKAKDGLRHAPGPVHRLHDPRPHSRGTGQGRTEKLLKKRSGEKEHA